ncbi:myotubularin-related protein 11 isoform X2 [Bombina bombina]|uniref:myotubularin-related protein 11 isoform X2 n=1 Tax=Bombina bombina TaxID=8345 RepID=UPI00235B22EE|nr:myotubularin-related protein 11 isoform X2 [Bombina bombina]
MLLRATTTFTFKQDPNDNLEGKSKLQSNLTACSTNLKTLPGESVKVEVTVKKRLFFKDGHLYLPGTLYCTSHRIAFRSELYHSNQDSSKHLLVDNDNDVALACIDKIVAVANQSKMKVLTAQSNLKFTPEELLIYCKGFQLIHFNFSGKSQLSDALKITRAIIENQQKNGLAMQPGSNKLINSMERGKMDFPTRMFESSEDWESEIERLGASAWRVSPANERCDSSTSLSKYLVVPCKLLDNDLKKTFTHFNQRRIPRWCWHHSGGSDLLRSAGFQTTTDPDKDDIRCILSLLSANHSQCVIVDTSDELPTVPDIQLSFLRLRSLCLNDASVAVSDEKWLSNLEATHWLDHVRFCLKKASDVSVLLSERRRSVVLRESSDRDMNCLLTSLVQVISDPHARTFSGFQSLVQKEWISSGHPFLQRINPFKENDKEESPVFLLFLDCVWQLIQQFQSAFEFTESYLIALHDSTYNLFCNNFTHNCQWDRSRGSQRHSFSQTYTPVNGWRNIMREYNSAKEGTQGPPNVWEWSMFYSHYHRQQFKNPTYQSREPSVLNGNGITNDTDKLDPFNQTTVYLLSKGSLILQSPFLPWKSGTVSKRVARRAQSSESLLEEERQLRSNLSPPHCTSDLLLPLCVGPWVQLWRRCYLRCSPEMQCDVSTLSTASLAKELNILQEKLKNQCVDRSQKQRNLNQTTRKGSSPAPYR